MRRRGCGSSFAGDHDFLVRRGCGSSFAGGRRVVFSGDHDFLDDLDMTLTRE